MSDRDGSRMTGDDTLGRQITANLRGLDSFIPAAPPFAQIESPALRPLERRGKSAVSARLKVRSATGLLAAGLVAVVVLGSGVWRTGHSAGAVDSPTASDVSTSEVSTTGVSDASSEASSEPSTDVTATPTSTPEPGSFAVASFGTGKPPASAPWHSAEVYLLGLMNCTRSGGWVVAGGACSSDAHHTLAAQPALVLDADISDKVARPYAKYLADNGLLSHTLLDSTPQSRLCAAGFCGSVWGENLASPGSSGKDGMITVEIFYQNESFCKCQHYANIMNPRYTRVGIGVWVTSGHARIVIDFSE